MQFAYKFFISLISWIRYLSSNVLKSFVYSVLSAYLITKQGNMPIKPEWARTYIGIYLTGIGGLRVGKRGICDLPHSPSLAVRIGHQCYWISKCEKKTLASQEQLLLTESKYSACKNNTLKMTMTKAEIYLQIFVGTISQQHRDAFIMLVRIEDEPFVLLLLHHINLI